MHSVMGSGRLIAGRYRLHGPIGRGAMGIVWRGRDELLDRDVAVKEVQITAQASPAEAETVYQRTLREARTAARLSHPAVVTVFDVVEENGTPWIVMELVEARSLDRVITEDGPLPPPQAAELGASLVAALAIAHAAGVLHRDVKPSNVLVTTAGKAVLTDFGIATFAGDPGLTHVGMVVGTPGFTAPERVRGQDATSASDLWSLGATLYTAVEGHGPFDRVGGATAITAGVATEGAPRAPSAGPLGPVIDALLSRDPDARPDAGTTATLLSDVIATTAAGTSPSGPSAAFLDPPVFAELSMPEPESEPATSATGGSADSPGRGAAALVPAGVVAGVVADGQAGRDGNGPVFWAPLRHSQSRRDDRAGDGRGDRSHQGGPAGPGGEGDGDGMRWRWRGGATTTMPRRKKLLVAAGGLAVLAVAAVVSWSFLSHSETSQALDSPAAPGITVHGSTVAGPAGHRSDPGQPAPASPGSSGQPSVGPTGQPGSSPASSQGGPSVSPSASPSPLPSPSPTGPVLPAGYTWHRFTAATMGSTAGFEIGMPRLWQQSVSGKSAALTEPVSNFHLVVNLAPWTYAAPLTQAQYLQRTYAKAEPGYRLLTLGAIGFKSIGGYEAAPAAELKFRWTKSVLGTVTELVVVVSLPTKSGVQPFTFTLWAPSATFALANGTFHTAMTTFRPLPS